jgi:hypothetical protein
VITGSAVDIAVYRHSAPRGRLEGDEHTKSRAAVKADTIMAANTPQNFTSLFIWVLLSFKLGKIVVCTEI